MSAYRKIAAIPIAWASFFLVAIFALPDAWRAGIMRVEIESSKSLAVVGCLVAASMFEKGDYLRRAWIYGAACYVALLTRDTVLLTTTPGTVLVGLRVESIQGFLVVIGNVFSVLGAWRLARAWSIAGLELPGSRATKLGLIAGAGFLAVAIAGADLLIDTKTMLGGDLGALVGVASDVGDIFGLCLIAPVLLTAIAMRGGVLKWPWGLMAACLLFWLGYDAVTTLDHAAAGHESLLRLVKETLRALACASECAAGLAQRRVLIDPSPGDEARQ